MEGLKETKTFFKSNEFNLTDYEDVYFEEGEDEDIEEVKERKSVIKEDTFVPDLSHREFISAESWGKTVNISSRILKTTKNSVTCECLVDRENKVFQSRSFSRQLFEHIEPLDKNKLVIIKIRSKIGSSRIDIFNGENLIDSSLFEVKDNWESLRGSGLDTPLSF